MTVYASVSIFIEWTFSRDDLHIKVYLRLKVFVEIEIFIFIFHPSSIRTLYFGFFFLLYFLCIFTNKKLIIDLLNFSLSLPNFHPHNVPKGLAILVTPLPMKTS